MMKATIYHGVGKIALERLELPSPGPDDVRIRNARAGICGTDLHAYLVEGESVGIHPGNQFGHEFVGVVDAIGENVQGIYKNMRVFINPTRVKPEGAELSSTEIADMAGAFSEYMIVEQAKLDDNIFPLPDTLNFDKAVLAEPLSVSMHSVNRAQARPGDKALIYGGGPIGLLALAALRSVGVEDVVVSEIKAKRLEIVEKLGGIPYDATQGDLMGFVKEKFGTRIGNSGEETLNVDVVIDAAGFKGVLEEFMANAKTLSRMVYVALNARQESFSPLHLLAKEVSIIGSRGYQPEDIKQAIQILDENQIPVESIITSVFPIDQVVEAFDQAGNADQEVKVLINYGVQ